MRVKIKRTPGTEANPAGALTRANRVDNRLALTTAVRVAGIVLHREAGQIVSEIAAYPQALVRAHEGMLSVVDRVAGAAVRLEPAARGVLPAWDRAVVAAAGGGGRQIVNEEMHVNSIEPNTLARKALVGLTLVALTCALALFCSSLVRSQTKPADSCHNASKPLAVRKRQPTHSLKQRRPMMCPL